MSFCSFSIKFLLLVNISLQGICIPNPSFLLTVLLVTTAVHNFSSSKWRKRKIIFANLPLSLFIRWPITEPFFITATAYFSKVFFGSIRHVNFLPIKGIQILLCSWYSMIWHNISYSLISTMGNSSSCSGDSIFDFSFGELSEILIKTLQHSFLSFCCLFCIQQKFKCFLSSFNWNTWTNLFGNCNCVNYTT